MRKTVIVSLVVIFIAGSMTIGYFLGQNKNINDNANEKVEPTIMSYDTPS